MGLFKRLRKVSIIWNAPLVVVFLCGGNRKGELVKVGDCGTFDS